MIKKFLLVGLVLALGGCYYSPYPYHPSYIYCHDGYHCDRIYPRYYGR